MQARYTKPMKVRGLQGIRGGLLGSPYRRLMIYCWGYAMVDPCVWKCLHGGNSLLFGRPYAGADHEPVLAN